MIAFKIEEIKNVEITYPGKDDTIIVEYTRDGKGFIIKYKHLPEIEYDSNEKFCEYCSTYFDVNDTSICPNCENTPQIIGEKDLIDIIMWSLDEVYDDPEIGNKVKINGEYIE